MTLPALTSGLWPHPQSAGWPRGRPGCAGHGPWPGNCRLMTGPIWHGRGYARMRHALTWAPDRPGAGPSRYAALAGAITRTGGWVATLAVRLARVTLEAARGGDAVRAVIMVMSKGGSGSTGSRGWRSAFWWPSLAGSFWLRLFPRAGRRTPFPGPPAARHGYDVIVYSGQPLPQLARLPHVASALPVPATFTGQLRCASCRTPIDADARRSTRCRRGAAADGDPPVPGGRPTSRIPMRSWPRSPSPKQRRARRLGDPGSGGQRGPAERGARGPFPSHEPRAAGGGHRGRRERISLRGRWTLRPVRHDGVRRGGRSPRRAAVHVLRAADPRRR